MIKKVLLFFLFVFLSLTSCANNSFINDFNKNSDYHYKFNETYEDLNIVRTHYTLRKSETLTIVFVLPLNANYNYLKQLLETHDETTSVIPFQELGSSVIYYFKQDNNKYTLRKIWSNFGEYKIFGYEAIFEKDGENKLMHHLIDNYNFTRKLNVANALEMAWLENENMKIVIQTDNVTISLY